MKETRNKQRTKEYEKKSQSRFKKKMQILWGLALYFLITCIGTE